MTNELFDRFCSAWDADAVVELVARDDAVPMLASFFSGEARNWFGSPYKDIGALGSALEAAARLGPRAKPLEAYLRAAGALGWPRAATALGRLETLEPASVDVLVTMLDHGFSDAPAEAAAALIKRGFGDLPAISALKGRSEFWRRLIIRLQRDGHSVSSG